MKKRVLSMFMALALCLTLLPAPAWAAEADAPEGGAAQVTTADNKEQVYGTFDKAWSAAIKSEGSTLKLLSDVELPKEVGENGLSVSEGSFTLDLNNKTLKGAIWKQLLEVSGTANITIKNGSLVNTQTGPAATATATELVALKISGGTVALDNVNLTSGIDTEDKRTSALYITGGSLTVTGSTFTGEVGVFCENSGTRPALSIADATLNNGIFYWVADAQASDTAGLEAIFAAGSMLFDQNSKYIDLASKEYWHIDIENVGAIFFYTEKCIVKPHTHKVVNGACECGATFAASVTQNGAVTYYKDFHTALNAAKAGDTLTLLADVQGDVTVTIDKAITFDLNGHRIYDLTVRCKITLKDSAGGTGKIAEWLRVENGLNIGDLLEPGYALRNAETGAWYGATEQTVGNVTVQQVPITSVTLTALNADGTAASTSIPYGTTGGIKLSASCTRQGAGELSCQWYTIGGTLQLIDGATEPVYQLPADLSVGEHTYRVTFTADGYSKSADITITITAPKIDLANAEVTIDPWYTDGKVRFNPNDSAASVLIFSNNGVYNEITVTANGEKYTLSNDDYTYEGATATRVGKYTLTITATDSCANFKGSKAIPWEVTPYQLWRPLFQGSQTYTKTYDGTTTLPGSYTWLADFFAREGADSNVTLKSGDYEVTAAEFVSADADENKPINQTITLKNENFVFYPTEIINIPGITTTDKTLTYTNFTPTEAYPSGGTTFNIEKAPMPDFDKEVTLDIVNNHADTYTVDLSALLPKLESPKKYGEVTYELGAVSINGGYYNATKRSAEVKDGKLILPIQAVETKETGSIGSVKVNVSTTNYQDFTLTVNVNAANKSVSSSGGGGSSSASKTSTTTNADGSVTKTETKSDGTVVETTTGKDGSTTKTETKKDGSSVTEAKAAGIPVILVDRLITTEDESLYACFVGADFIKEGRSAGEFLLKKADAMGAEHLNIVEITGTEDSTPQRQRHQGFHDTIAGDERFTVLESISGDFLVSKGEECMRYLLDKYGEDIDVLYSHNDGMTLGAIDAIREYGLSPGSDIIIITVDGEQAAIDLLKAGEINCVVECTPNLGDSVMELAKKLAAGEDVPRMSHPDEDVFTEFDDLSDLAPRGY